MPTIKGGNPSIEREFEWHFWEVELDGSNPAENTGEVNVPLITLPQGTVVAGALSMTLTAEAGATSSALDLEVGGVTLADFGADSLGSLGRFSLDDGSTTGDAPLATGILSTASAVLNCEVTYAGTATTGPRFLVGVLCGRFEY